jgi:hypothetical protein
MRAACGHGPGRDRARLTHVFFLALGEQEGQILLGFVLWRWSFGQETRTVSQGARRLSHRCRINGNGSHMHGGEHAISKRQALVLGQAWQAVCGPGVRN